MRRKARGIGPAVCASAVTVGILLFGAAAFANDERTVLLPRLRNGDTLNYVTHARLDRHVQTKSNVVSMLRPDEVRRDLAAAVRLSVEQIRPVDNRLMMAAETEVATEGEQAASGAAKTPKVSFTIGGDGSVTRAEGLDDLDPEQRLAWQFWVAQFAFGWTLAPGGVKPGEKWKSQEAEKTPTPIANLMWERETTYVRNDKCPILANEQCAVFLTSATLKQKSKPDDTTPEDYQIRELKTSGTAEGTNETILYIQLKTGLLVRASEDLQQSMEVTITKADDSNRVHYQINVTSHFETVLVPRGGAK